MLYEWLSCAKQQNKARHKAILNSIRHGVCRRSSSLPCLFFLFPFSSQMPQKHDRFTLSPRPRSKSLIERHTTDPPHGVAAPAPALQPEIIREMFRAICALRKRERAGVCPACKLLTWECFFFFFAFESLEHSLAETSSFFRN